MSGKYIVALLASATCMAAPVAEAKFVAGLADVTDVTATPGNRNATAAAGGFYGNDKEDEVLSLLDGATFGGSDIFGLDLDWDFGGKTDDDSSGPFVTNLGSSTGTLTFDTAPTGPFVIGIKASTYYALYYFDATFTDITSIAYDTSGAAVKSNDSNSKNNKSNKKNQVVRLNASTDSEGQGPGLSHVSLFTANSPPPGPPVVPTPTAALGTGLLLAGLAMRRRRRD